MIRYGRRYDVIPVVKGVVEDDLPGKPFIERLTHLPLDFVRFVDNLCQDLETRFGHCFRSSAACIIDGIERRPAPRTRNLGEEAVLDGIELGAVRRIVHDEDFQANAVSKIHKVLLDDTVSAGVGSATVAEDDEHLGIRVEMLHVAVPDTLYVFTYKLRGVVAGANGKVSGVVRQVIDAVRHNRAVGEGLEVMVEGLGRGSAVHLPATLEVADHLLLLGIDADDGDTRLDAAALSGANLHELGVPVLRLAQRQALGERPSPESRGLEHLPYYIFRHIMPTRKELTTNLLDTEVEPDDTLVLRKACQVAGDDVVEGRQPFRMLVGFPFRSAAGHPLPAIGRGYMVQKFKNCFGNGVGRTAKSLAYSLYRASCGARCLACNKMPSVAFFECAKVLHFRLANLYWRFLLQSCNYLLFNYKDTKISPVILYLKC